MWCCKNRDLNVPRMITWVVIEPENSLWFHISSLFSLTPFPLISFFLCFFGSSGHCYYQTIVTPVSLPDSPCSRIPHTVTLVSIPASAEGNNGRRGRGFSVAIDQPLSPTDSYSPEQGRTVRVSQWVHLSVFVCRYGAWERMKEGGVKIEDSVIDEIDLKMYNGIERDGNEQKSQLFAWAETLSDLRSGFIVCRKVWKLFFNIFSPYGSSLFRVDADCISPDVKNSIHVGDRILEINGTPIHNVPLDEVFTTLLLTHCYRNLLYCHYANGISR